MKSISFGLGLFLLAIGSAMAESTPTNYRCGFEEGTANEESLDLQLEVKHDGSTTARQSRLVAGLQARLGSDGSKLTVDIWANWDQAPKIPKRIAQFITIPNVPFQILFPLENAYMHFRCIPVFN